MSNASSNRFGSSKLRPGFLAEMQRYPSNGWIAGVCAGVADYFDWKPQVVRLVVFLLALFTAFWPVALVYCIFWYVMDDGDLRGGVHPKWSDLPPAGPAPAPASPGGATVGSSTATMSDIKERFSRLDSRLRKLEEAALNKDDALRREIDKLGGTPPQS